MESPFVRSMSVGGGDPSLSQCVSYGTTCDSVYPYHHQLEQHQGSLVLESQGNRWSPLECPYSSLVDLPRRRSETAFYPVLASQSPPQSDPDQAPLRGPLMASPPAVSHSTIRNKSRSASVTPTQTLVVKVEPVGEKKSASPSEDGEGQIPEQDKRLRREIANSNERRRMQCINNGFVSLQTILPKNYMKRGEKMSKAAVLQSTVDYIRKLETDNCKLQASNDALLARVEGTKEAQAEGQGQAEAQPQSHDGRFPNTNSPNPSPKDLVNMVEYWRHKYEQERLLRGQTEEHLQRMQYCPLEPITLPMEEYPVSPYQSSSIKIEKVDISSQCPELPPSSSPAQAIPVATTTTPVSSLGERESKRKSSLSCPCGSLTCNVLVQDDEASGKRKAMSGFDVLFEAITYSEHIWDCTRSDSGCSEETVESAEAPKKRRKHHERRCL